jgi:hypothetical protein
MSSSPRKDFVTTRLEGMINLGQQIRAAFAVTRCVVSVESISTVTMNYTFIVVNSTRDVIFATGVMQAN